jgi:hypothetical protein
MADATGYKSAEQAQITGRDNQYVADVKPDNSGDNRLYVKSQPSFADPKKLIRERIKLGGTGTDDLAINGNSPKVFTFNALPAGQDDILISSIKFFGTDGNIKVSIGNFMGLNSALTNGILIEFETSGIVTFSETIKNTVELLGLFSSGAGENKIIPASGGDYLESKFDLTQKSLELNLKSGTADLIRVTVRDNLSSVDALYMLIDGRLA